MTLSKAINQCYRVAKNKMVEAETLRDGYDVFAQDCLDDADVHLQLARWLKGLKSIHEEIDDMDDEDEITIGYLRELMYCGGEE